MTIKRSASVDHFLNRHVRQFLSDPDITEIAINRPGEIWVERQGDWEKHDDGSLDWETLDALATAVAVWVRNDVSDVHPILSAILPDGERIQVVTSPACELGTVSMTIRKPSAEIFTLDQYQEQGCFDKVHLKIGNNLTSGERRLQRLLTSCAYGEFLGEAVRQGKVIVVAGETGSGKTTLMKALMRQIPVTQRIVTIEDVAELFLPLHPNHVHLFYQAEMADAASAQVTATQALKCSLRMKPDRIMLAELRGGETYDFLNVAASGHAGSITSCHAGSCELALERMALMVLQSPQGQSLPYEVIKRLLYLVVDVVVHFQNDTINDTGRHITEIWFEPEQKRTLMAA